MNYRKKEKYFSYRFDELLAELTGRAKLLDLEGHVLLGLRVKGRILYRAVNKHPDMTADLQEENIYMERNIVSWWSFP